MGAREQAEKYASETQGDKATVQLAWMDGYIAGMTRSMEVFKLEKRDRPEMTKETYTCPCCIDTDQHMFSLPDGFGYSKVCGKCYEKLTGQEP